MKQKSKEADMIPNNWNSAYEYEHERRNDERRAAAEYHRVRELLGKHHSRLSFPMLLAGIAAAIVVLIRLF
jgi:hypothetical protein